MVVPLARETVKVPDGVDVTIEGLKVTVKGKNATLTRAFVAPGVRIVRKDATVLVEADFARRKTRALVGTLGSHLRNMVAGSVKDWEYHMKVVYSHFPIKTKVAGATFVVDNFLGEKTPRKAPIRPGVKIEVKGEQVVLTGADVEAVSQTAANIEQACRVRGFDRRVFQDGIYITAKAVST